MDYPASAYEDEYSADEDEYSADEDEYSSSDCESASGNSPPIVLAFTRVAILLW